MKLNELYEQVCTKKGIEKKLSELYSQKSRLEGKINLLKSKYDKEQKDVDRLEKVSLSALFYSLTGRKDEMLDKETREMLRAKAEYDAAVFQLDGITRDISRYVQQKFDIKDCEEQYEAVLKEKLQSMGENDENILKMNNRLAESEVVCRELNEAIVAGRKARDKAVQADRNLNSADGWAMFDVFGGGIVADAMKYSRMDSAQNIIYEMQQELSRFKTELADVDIHTDIDMYIGDFLRLADFMWDNIFTDVAVMNKIQNARTKIFEVITHLDKAICNLENMEKQEKEKQSALKQSLEQLAMEKDIQ
ncbi:MAG: hypothetical protein IJN69_07355 [Oscillospiraceae bacterium]|nr:hypothetical protein [Oscillospiraceae bacterium]MBR2503876.1 hypothetical protein [Oscillospiraceae bacterium]